MSYTDIDIEKYQAQFENNADADYVLVDVREADEYAEGHLPGTIHVPLSEFQTRYTEIGKEKPIVLVCARGGRSAQAAEFLGAQGYTDLYNLEGGTMGWIQQGLPVEK